MAELLVRAKVKNVGGMTKTYVDIVSDLSTVQKRKLLSQLLGAIRRELKKVS